MQRRGLLDHRRGDVDAKIVAGSAGRTQGSVEGAIAAAEVAQAEFRLGAEHARHLL